MDAPVSLHCPACNQIVSAQDKLCPNCGWILIVEDSEPELESLASELNAGSGVENEKKLDLPIPLANERNQVSNLHEKGKQPNSLARKKNRRKISTQAGSPARKKKRRKILPQEISERPSASNGSDANLVTHPIKHTCTGSLDLLLVQEQCWALEGEIHTLDAPWVLLHPAQITGVANCEILSEASGAVLVLRGPGPWRFENVKFVYMGDGPADVVRVEGGQVEFVNCVFSGAKGSLEVDGRECGGIGVRAVGAAHIVLRDCWSEENSFHGISIQDMAQASITTNTVCRKNGWSGITFRDSAKGLVSGCTCSENIKTGISLKGQASPVVEGNICSGNKVGIAVQSTGFAVVQGNRCMGNNAAGILVRGEAQPLLTRNQCKENLIGIVYQEKASGLVYGNRCLSNENHGISIGGKASPALFANNCEENTHCGLVFLEEAQGTAGRNSFRKNQGYGIFCEKGARPKLFDNEFSENILGTELK